jgi:hypothetical protein
MSAVNMREHALWLAKKGAGIFPLHSVIEIAGKYRCTCGKAGCADQGKHPNARYVPHGFKNATSDLRLVDHWWQCVPDANIGLATGNVLVLDVDPRNGGDQSLRDLEAKHGELPHTVRAFTGGGGEHAYFRPTHPGIGGTTLAPGIDVKALGGYVVAPPSLHVSGRRYEWSVDHHPQNTRIAPLPDWIAARLAQSNRSPTITAEEWRRRIGDGIPEGTRREKLLSVAGHIFSKGVSSGVGYTLLHSLNLTHCRPPLPEDELSAFAADIWRKEDEKRAKKFDLVHTAGSAYERR